MFVPQTENSLNFSLYEYSHISLTMRPTICTLQEYIKHNTLRYIVKLKLSLVNVLPNRLLPLDHHEPVLPKVRKKCPQSPPAGLVMPSLLAIWIMLPVVTR